MNGHSSDREYILLMISAVLMIALLVVLAIWHYNDKPDITYYPDPIGPEWRQPRPMVGLDTLLNEQILRGIEYYTIPIEGENRKEIRDDNDER